MTDAGRVTQRGKDVSFAKTVPQPIISESEVSSDWRVVLHYVQSDRRLADTPQDIPRSGLNDLSPMFLPRASHALSFLSLFVITPVFAQSGDRRGEVQRPVGDHIKIPPAPFLSPQEEAATFKLAPG